MTYFQCFQDLMRHAKLLYWVKDEGDANLTAQTNIWWLPKNSLNISSHPRHWGHYHLARGFNGFVCRWFLSSIQNTVLKNFLTIRACLFETKTSIFPLIAFSEHMYFHRSLKEKSQTFNIGIIHRSLIFFFFFFCKGSFQSN